MAAVVGEEVAKGIAETTGEEIASDGVKNATEKFVESAEPEILSALADNGTLAETVAKGAESAGLHTSEEIGNEAVDVLAKKAELNAATTDGKIAIASSKATPAEAVAVDSTKSAIATQGPKAIGQKVLDFFKSSAKAIAQAIADHPYLFMIGIGVAGLALYAVITGKSFGEAAGELVTVATKNLGTFLQTVGSALIDALKSIFGKLLPILAGVGGVVLLIIIIIAIVKRMRKNKVAPTASGVPTAPPLTLSEPHAYYYY